MRLGVDRALPEGMSPTTPGLVVLREESTYHVFAFFTQRAEGSLATWGYAWCSASRMAGEQIGSNAADGNEEGNLGACISRAWQRAIAGLQSPSFLPVQPVAAENGHVKKSEKEGSRAT